MLLLAATAACMAECDRQILIMGAIAFAIVLVLLAMTRRA